MKYMHRSLFLLFTSYFMSSSCMEDMFYNPNNKYAEANKEFVSANYGEAQNLYENGNGNAGNLPLDFKNPGRDEEQ